ncbi:hypothetical protein GCWB2_02560 [Gordonia rubripertincta]|nr:hypothetical protein GCWB2_02560 [Gordonia rubripertincta]
MVTASAIERGSGRPYRPRAAIFRAVLPGLLAAGEGSGATSVAVVSPAAISQAHNAFAFMRRAPRGCLPPVLGSAGVGARSFSSGSGLALRTSVPLLYTVIAVTSSDPGPNVERLPELAGKCCGAAHPRVARAPEGSEGGAAGVSRGRFRVPAGFRFVMTIRPRGPTATGVVDAPVRYLPTAIFLTKTRLLDRGVLTPGAPRGSERTFAKTNCCTCKESGAVCIVVVPGSDTGAFQPDPPGLKRDNPGLLPPLAGVVFYLKVVSPRGLSLTQQL